MGFAITPKCESSNTGGASNFSAPHLNILSDAQRELIWISILGPLPLTLLLPHVDFFWTGALTVLINLIMASAFPSIMIYAMELVSNRIGLVGGLFYGLNFGMGGIAAAILGGMADSIGIERV